MKKIFITVSIVLFLFSLYWKFYKLDRTFIRTSNGKYEVTYLRKGNNVYIIPFKYWGINPSYNYLQIDRKNFGEEVNLITLITTSEFSLVIVYNSGIILKNNLNPDVIVYSNNEIFEKESLYRIYLSNSDNVTKLDLGSIYIYNKLIYIFLLLTTCFSIIITIIIQLKKIAFPSLSLGSINKG